jgi:hypothetical protein
MVGEYVIAGADVFSPRADEDVRQALAYAAWRVEEIEVPLPAA